MGWSISPSQPSGQAPESSPVPMRRGIPTLLSLNRGRAGAAHADLDGILGARRAEKRRGVHYPTRPNPDQSSGRGPQSLAASTWPSLKLVRLGSEAPQIQFRKVAEALEVDHHSSFVVWLAPVSGTAQCGRGNTGQWNAQSPGRTFASHSVIGKRPGTELHPLRTRTGGPCGQIGAQAQLPAALPARCSEQYVAGDVVFATSFTTRTARHLPVSSHRVDDDTLDSFRSLSRYGCCFCARCSKQPLSA